MRITLSPQCPEQSISVAVSGDILSINGDVLDLSVVAEGSDIEDSLARSLHPMIAGPIYREGGELHITLILPLPLDCTDPWMCFPEPITVTEDGPVGLPFATYSETEDREVEGGTNIVTTTYRWHREPEVSTVFVADPTDEDA